MGKKNKKMLILKPGSLTWALGPGLDGLYNGGEVERSL